MSILFKAGTIVSPALMAAKALAMVWASTPCEASTNNNAPSQHAKLRETS